MHAYVHKGVDLIYLRTINVAKNVKHSKENKKTIDEIQKNKKIIKRDVIHKNGMCTGKNNK